MRIGFAGTPEFAVIVLNRLITSGHSVMRVLTQPPRPKGRRGKTTPSPVQQQAEELGIDVRSPTRLSDHYTLVSDLDVLVVAAFGLLLPNSILNGPTHGCINVHASLLPRWRGAAPIEHAILAGDKQTGVSIMRVEKELDAGAVYRQHELSLSGMESSNEIALRLADMGAAALLSVLDELKKGILADPTPQPSEGITYAPKIESHLSRIRWTDDATYIERQVRAFGCRTASFATIGDTRIRILQASVVRGKFEPGRITKSGKNYIVGCGKDGLQLDIVQLNRGKGTRAPAHVVANGYPYIIGDGIHFDVI